jgi:alkylation response protein AidB-like acyl-CoA dehydrogenase
MEKSRFFDLLTEGRRGRHIHCRLIGISMTNNTLESVKEHDIVVAARKLAPQIIAARDEAEKMRRTPPALAKAIGDAGLYQMFLPHSVGGMELSPLIAFEAIEELSRADGSVGWCAMIASDVAMITGCRQIPFAR